MPPLTNAEKQQALRERNSQGGKLKPVTVWLVRSPKARELLKKYVARLNQRHKED